jgi:predicted ester cyclase
MGASEEAVVRRFYEDMCTGRKLDLADELFTPDHVMHDPQVPSGPGPQGMADLVSVYQNGADGHWTIEELFSASDRVVVRWTGSGSHIGELNGVPATGRPIRVDAISIHRMTGSKIAETWEVWDTLGLLQQIGVVPSAG